MSEFHPGDPAWTKQQHIDYVRDEARVKAIRQWKRLPWWSRLTNQPEQFYEEPDIEELSKNWVCSD